MGLFWDGMSGTLTAIIKHVWRGTNLMTNQTSKDTFLSRVSALLIPLCTSPVLLLFRNDAGRKLAAWVIAMALVASARIFWGRRRHLWFWATLAILTVLHALLILYVPWPDVHGPIGGPALFPVGLLDIGIMCGCLKLIEKLMKRSGETGSPA
jgi:hypothetical protein